MKFISILVLCAFAFAVEAKNGLLKTNFRVYPKNVPSSMSTDTPQVRSENLLYYGGPVISHVRVVTVFWGAKVDMELQQNLGGFYASLVNSSHMDWLNQYQTNIKAVDGRQGTNQTIGRGSYVGEYVIQPQNTSKNIDDVDVHAELEYQISTNHLPKPDENTLYMIHFPAGMSNTIQGAKSCQNFCAYHFATVSKNYGNIYYGVMPDYKSGMCSYACGFGSNAFDTTTVISAHEFTEAVTDPFPTPADKPVYPQAWNTSKGEEIADLCQASADLVTTNRTYKVSKEWDNAGGSCYSGPWKSDH